MCVETDHLSNKNHNNKGYIRYNSDGMTHRYSVKLLPLGGISFGGLKKAFSLVISAKDMSHQFAYPSWSEDFIKVDVELKTRSIIRFTIFTLSIKSAYLSTLNLQKNSVDGYYTAKYVEKLDW